MVTYRGSGPWGPGQGQNLAASQIDANFHELAQRLIELETNPPAPIGIADIQLLPTGLMITLTDGQSFGPYRVDGVPLPTEAITEYTPPTEWPDNSDIVFNIHDLGTEGSPAHLSDWLAISPGISEVDVALDIGAQDSSRLVVIGAYFVLSEADRVGLSYTPAGGFEQDAPNLAHSVSTDNQWGALMTAIGIPLGTTVGLHFRTQGLASIDELAIVVWRSTELMLGTLGEHDRIANLPDQGGLNESFEVAPGGIAFCLGGRTQSSEYETITGFDHDIDGTLAGQAIGVAFGRSITSGSLTVPNDIQGGRAVAISRRPAA